MSRHSCQAEMCNVQGTECSHHPNAYGACRQIDLTEVDSRLDRTQENGAKDCIKFARSETFASPAARDMK